MRLCEEGRGLVRRAAEHVDYAVVAVQLAQHAGHRMRLVNRVLALRVVGALVVVLATERASLGLGVEHADHVRHCEGEAPGEVDAEEHVVLTLGLRGEDRLAALANLDRVVAHVHLDVGREVLGVHAAQPLEVGEEEGEERRDELLGTQHPAGDFGLAHARDQLDQRLAVAADRLRHGGAARLEPEAADEAQAQGHVRGPAADPAVHRASLVQEVVRQRGLQHRILDHVHHLDKPAEPHIAVPILRQSEQLQRLAGQRIRADGVVRHLVAQTLEHGVNLLVHCSTSLVAVLPQGLPSIRKAPQEDLSH